MRRALSTRPCAGRTHAGGVSLQMPTSNATTGRRQSGMGILEELPMKLFYAVGRLQRGRSHCTERSRTFVCLRARRSAAKDHWIAAHNPSLTVTGQLGRTRLIEALAFIATEVHKGFHQFFVEGADEDKSQASVVLYRRLQFLADRTLGGYLFGDRPTVAHFYLFVMLLWAGKFHTALPGALSALRERTLLRPAVKAAMEAERWVYPAPAVIAEINNKAGNT